MLPDITAPQFELTIPSSQKIVKYRPYLVKEEKLLYIASQSGEHRDIVNAIKQVIATCVETDINDLTHFDFEYIFIKLRSKSVGEQADFKITHKCDDQTEHGNDVAIDLDHVEVVFPEGVSDVIMLTDTVGVKVRYPSIDDIGQLDNPDIDAILDLFANCIVQVFDADAVHDQFEKSEVRNWIENLSEKQFVKITAFFENMPKVSHTLKYTCGKCGVEEQVDIEGLHNFF